MLQKFGIYVLGLVALTLIVFLIGASIFGGSSSPYTDFILTFIAVYLVTSKVNLNEKEEG